MAFFLLFLIIVICFFAIKSITTKSPTKVLPPRRASRTTESKPQPATLRRPPPPPPPPPPPLLIQQQEKSSQEVAPHPIFPDYQLTYQDNIGNITDRRITIIKIEGDYVHAYCHLRKERRTFLIPRMISAVNCDTGEVVSDISDDLKKARQNSAYGVLDRMHEDLYPVMGVLLYLGKGDKRLMIDERNIIINCFKEICSDQRLTDEMVNDGINEMVTPSRTKFKKLVGKLAKMDLETQEIVARASSQLFSSRKKLNPIEEEAMNELRKKLSVKSRPQGA
jgi:hypothetical protein